jgi:hypothetical protein
MPLGRTRGVASAPCADAMRTASGPNTGHYMRGFGAQLDPIISSLSRCRGLEQHHAIASLSTGSLGNKGPSAFRSLPWAEGAFSHDASAKAARPVPEHRAVPDVQPPRASADLPRLSGHEPTS